MSVGLETFPIRAREHPTGLRCSHCMKLMVGPDGYAYEQEYATRLLKILHRGTRNVFLPSGEEITSIEEIVCLECAVKP